MSAESSKRYRERHPERVRACLRRVMKGKPRSTTKESRRAWNERNPEKVRAYAIMRNAIRTGKLVRPEKCEDCNTDPGKNRRGHMLIQAHHEDYGSPLIVRWLCVDCHRRLNRIEVSDRAVAH